MEINKKQISISDVKLNNGSYGRKLWVILGGKVYDLTGFSHPAGNEVFSNNTEDKLQDFLAIGHSTSARNLLKSFYIGDLKKESTSKYLY